MSRLFTASSQEREGAAVVGFAEGLADSRVDVDDPVFSLSCFSPCAMYRLRFVGAATGEQRFGG